LFDFYCWLCALGLIALGGQPDILVALGDTIAINSQNTALRPPEWMAKANTMMGLVLPQNPNSPLSVSATDFIIEVLNKTETPIRFVVLGSLTNLGKALMEEPHLAADIVFRSGVDVVLVPLDATNKALVTAAFYQRFSNDHITPQADFVFNIISNLEEHYDTFYFWDPLAAVIGTNRNLAAIQSHQLLVALEEGSENGRTKNVTAGGNTIEVCDDVDMAAFENLFLDVLNDRD